MNTLTTDVVIVGAGLAGLAAASTLTRAGRDVLLLEPGRPGGRAVSDRSGGALLNLGPHALYRRFPGEAVLKELGVTPSGGRPSPDGLIFDAEGLYTLPATPGGLLTTDALRLPQRLALARAFLALLSPRPPQGTVSDWLARLARDPRVRSVLEATVRVATYAHAPDRFPASVAHAQVRGAALAGVRYLDGGWQSLVDGLLRTLPDGVLRPLRAESVEPGRVRCGDTVVEAREVVLAVPPGVAEALRPGAGADLLPLRAACLDLVLSSWEGERHLALGLDEAIYVSHHSEVADLGEGAVVHAARYLAPGERGSARPSLETCLDRVQPGWRDRVVTQRWLPAMTVTWAPPIEGLAARPGIQVEPGIWRCGDWVGPTGFLADAALASGHAVGLALAEQAKAA